MLTASSDGHRMATVRSFVLQISAKRSSWGWWPFMSITLPGKVSWMMHPELLALALQVHQR
jgi:hypothetical protein